MIRLDQRLYLLYVALLPIFLPFFWRVRANGPVVIVADAAFVATVMAWLVSLARGRTSIRWTPFYLFAGMYLGALSLSVLVSVETRASLLKLPGEIYLIAIAVLTLNLVRTRDDVKRVTQIWMASVAVVGLMGVMAIGLYYVGWNAQHVNFALERFGSLPPGNYPRIRSTFVNANTMCTYMGIGLMMLPLAHALGWIRTGWYHAVNALGWITAFFSLSPSLGGLFLARGWWEWKQRIRTPRDRAIGRLALAAGIGAAAVLFLAMLVDPAPQDPSSGVIIMGREIEASPRVRLWRRALGAIAARPVMGQGVGTDLEPMRYIAAAGEEQRLSDPHNVWLSVGVQAGLIGLAAFVALVAYLWRCTRQSTAADSEQALTRLALRGAFASVLFYMAFSGSFENARHLWLLMGLMAAVGDYEAP